MYDKVTKQRSTLPFSHCWSVRCETNGEGNHRTKTSGNKQSVRRSANKKMPKKKQKQLTDSCSPCYQTSLIDKMTGAAVVCSNVVFIHNLSSLKLTSYIVNTSCVYTTDIFLYSSGFQPFYNAGHTSSPKKCSRHTTNLYYIIL